MSVSPVFTRRLLLPVLLGLVQTLLLACAERPTAGLGHAGPEACPDRAAMAIDWPMKIGIGAWDQGPPGWAAARLEDLGVAWYYDWGPRPLKGASPGSPPEFVPMIWGASLLRDDPQALAEILSSDATTLLAFNEPDHPEQANMSVVEAVAQWPLLMATRLRLGSPATTRGGALPPGTWLPNFMTAVREFGLRVDFIAVHYYAATPDVAAFRSFLEQVHDAYGRPVWVTEWALVDPASRTDGRARYSAEEAACFYRAAAAMLDDLGFVERHAWFAAFDGGEGWHLDTHAIANDGSLTPVGQAILDATGAAAE